MRITDRYQSAIERVAPAKPVASTAKAAATAESSSSNVLDVKMSAEAQELSNRAAGVTQLKEQVANGSFKIDADAIASRLVGSGE